MFGTTNVPNMGVKPPDPIFLAQNSNAEHGYRSKHSDVEKYSIFKNIILKSPPTVGDKQQPSHLESFDL